MSIAVSRSFCLLSWFINLWSHCELLEHVLWELSLFWMLFSQCWQLYGFSSVWVLVWRWRINLWVIYFSHCSQLKALCEPLCVCLSCAFVAWVFSHSVLIMMNGSLYSIDCPLDVLIKCALPGLISKRACYHNNCIKASYIHVSRKYAFVYLF